MSAYVKRFPENRLTEDPCSQGIFLQVCEALGYLHARRIAHRDIKLDNVLVNRHSVREGGPPLVKLIDFGWGRGFLREFSSRQFRHPAGRWYESSGP
jgi:serine/threonine protein kinase